MKKLIFICITSLLYAEDTLSILDKYHATLSDWIVLKSDEIDKYLSKKNDNKILSKTVIGIEYTLGYDTKDGFSNNIDFSFGLDLPRFKNKLHLMAESLRYDLKNIKNSPPKLFLKENEEKSYNVALEYNQINKNNMKFSFTGGVRFDKIFFEPYIGVIGRYKLKNIGNWDNTFQNKFLFYTSGEVDDIVSFENIYSFDEKSLVGIYNSIGFNSSTQYQSLGSEVSYFHQIDNNSYYKVGAQINGSLKNLTNPKIDRYKIYTQYKNNIANRDWLYYKITPSIAWKRENSFKTSFNLKLTIGAKFGNR